MHPAIPLLVIQDFYGYNLTTLFSELSGVSEKTLRSGGPKRKNKRSEFLNKAAEGGKVRLIEKVGMDRANHICEGMEDRCNGVVECWSQFIDLLSIYDKSKFRRSMAFANEMDRLQCSLSNAESQGLDVLALALLDVWSGYPDGQDADDDFLAAVDELKLNNFSIGAIKKIYNDICLDKVLDLLSIVDVELFDLLVGDSLPEIPLFMLLVPDEKAMSIVGDNVTFKRKSAIYPFANLLDFTAMWMEMSRNKKFPKKIPGKLKRLDMFGDDFSRVYLDRKRLYLHDYFRALIYARNYVRKGRGDPVVPFVLYAIASLIDVISVVRFEDGRKQFRFFSDESYRARWERTADLLRCETRPTARASWPDYVLQRVSR